MIKISFLKTKNLLYFQKTLFVHPRKEAFPAMGRMCFVELGDEMYLKVDNTLR